MSDKSVGTQLLEWSPGDLDPRTLARKIVGRDRLQARLFALGTVVIWLVAAALMFPLIADLGMLATDFGTTMRDVIAATGVKSALPERLERVSEVGSRSAVASVVLMGLAAVATLIAGRSSRRATLRQVNANLMLLSEQLRRLTEGKEAAGGDK